MPSITVSIRLPDKTHQILVRAARKLARMLHPLRGPGVTGLIEHELAGRSVRGLIDEYLDANGHSNPVRIPPKRRRLRS